MKQCSVFMAQSPEQSWMTFCKVDGNGFNKEAARDKITEVLENKKNAKSYQLNYIGLVNFEDTDPAMAHDTACFEKHDPVWLLGTSSNQLS